MKQTDRTRAEEVRSMKASGVVDRGYDVAADPEMNGYLRRWSRHLFSVGVPGRACVERLVRRMRGIDVS